jgi:hypothetical protein
MHNLPYAHDPEHCSGCGIKLQADDITKPGYIYTKKEANEDREKAFKRHKEEHKIFEDALQNLDVELITKLANTQKVVKEIKERPVEEFRPYEEDDAMFLEEMDSQQQEEQSHKEEKYDELTSPSISLPKPNYIRPIFCRRCHLLTYHSDPIHETTNPLIPPKTVNSIMNDIEARNKDPENPPLILHVIDVVDFPLSFIPFNVPHGSKVIFVINRADAVCERSSAMAHVRAYFREQIPIALSDAGMHLEAYEVHPCSALKGWGVGELLERIIETRNRDSNVYLIGIPLQRHCVK